MCAAGLLRGSAPSTTSTLRRALVSTRAALSPAAPPPMITTSCPMAQQCGRQSSFGKVCCRYGNDRGTTARRAASRARPDAGDVVRDDGHLEVDAVAPGDRPAQADAGAAAAVVADLPGVAGRPGRRARGGRSARPDEAART